MRREAMAVWQLAALALFFSAVAAGRGDEPKCKCHETGVPILGKIPYVSRLFKNIGVVHEPGCEAGQCQKTPCADQLERIGIDFNVCPECPEGQVLRFGPIGLAVAWEDAGHCQSQPCQVEQCHTQPCQACPAVALAKVGTCCAAGCCQTQCCAVKCAGQVATECKCADHHVTACKCADRDELIDQIVELTADKAAAEGALEAHEIVHEMLGEMTELVAKNAALEARLEAQADSAKLTEKLIALAVDNARLKAQVELAELKVSLMQQTIGVEVEKQMLAHRVAELEARLAAGEPAARTAKKAERKKALR